MEIVAMKTREPGNCPAPSLDVRSASASDSRSRVRNGGPRGSHPPELPAGKRGGWHHDSVYPSFRLTSFAPRALNFERSVPAQPEVTSRAPLNSSLDATQVRRRVWRLRRHGIAARIRARGREAAGGSRGR